jgi:hypothetical protein
VRLNSYIHTFTPGILVGIDVDKLTQEMNALGLIYQEDKEKIENS